MKKLLIKIKNNMARPKVILKKKSLSISINIELDDILTKICEEKNINKSKYIEYLIKKEMTPTDFSYIEDYLKIQKKG